MLAFVDYAAVIAELCPNGLQPNVHTQSALALLHQDLQGFNQERGLAVCSYL